MKEAVVQKSSDHLAQHYPVSIKGVVLVKGKIPLLKNERDEWELPGGKLEGDEDPSICLKREFQEELGIIVDPIILLDSWNYKIRKNVNVIIITYLCTTEAAQADCRVSDEHKELKFFLPQEAQNLIMPDGYKNSISRAISVPVLPFPCPL